MRNIIRETTEYLLSGPLSGAHWKTFTPDQIRELYCQTIDKLKKEIYGEKSFEGTPFYALHLVLDSKLKKSTSTPHSLEIISQYIL